MRTYHKGYFMLILGLPPNGEDDGNAEDKKQHQESQAPRFPPGDGLDSVSGQNTQAQHEEGCEGDVYTQHDQHPRFRQVPRFTQCILIRYRVLSTATWPNTRTLPFPRGQQGRISLTEATVSSSESQPPASTASCFACPGATSSATVSDSTTWADGPLSGVVIALCPNGKWQVCPLSAVVNTNC